MKRGSLNAPLRSLHFQRRSGIVDHTVGTCSLVGMMDYRRVPKTKWSCCECMQTEVPYTHLFRARREVLQDRMTHAHARSDCVLNKGRKTDRLIYTSRFVHAIYSSCIVLTKPGTVTGLL